MVHVKITDTGFGVVVVRPVPEVAEVSVIAGMGKNTFGSPAPEVGVNVQPWFWQLNGKMAPRS